MVHKLLCAGWFLTMPPKLGGQYMSIEVFEKWSLFICVGGLIAYMFFIVWDLAKKSKAGKFGTFIMFIGLGLGLAGFVVKGIMMLVSGE